MPPDFTTAVAFALVVVIIQIGILRLIDVNEKEPVWALALLVWLGVVFAAAAAIAIPGDVRTDEGLGVVLTASLAILGAIVAGMATIHLINRRRRWSEINGLVDGLIYGAAAGFGFATGDALLRDTFASIDEIQVADQTTLGELLWMTAQLALSHAVLGAILGAGVFLATSRRSLAVRLAPIAALGLAVAIQLGYGAAALEDFQVGPSLTLVGALWLLAIVALAVGLFLNGLRNESKVTKRELEGERAAGVVTPEEWELFVDPRERRRQRRTMFVRGDFEQLASERAIQNRQVALALEKNRLRSLDLDPDRAQSTTALREEIAVERARREPARTGGPHPELAGRGRWLIRAGGVALLVGGGALVVAAGGVEEPTATETKATIFEREQAALEPNYPRPIRASILALVGAWRLQEARESNLVDRGAAEAYEVEYSRAGSDPLEYTIAAFGDAAGAERSLDVLVDSDAPLDGLGWTDGAQTTLLIGASEDVASFCNVLPANRRPPDRLEAFEASISESLGREWRPAPTRNFPVRFRGPEGSILLGRSLSRPAETSLEFARDAEDTFASFNEYEEISLEPVDLRSAAGGYARTFEWGGGSRWRGIALYVSECGSGYELAAAAKVSAYERLGPVFDRVFGGL